MRIGILQLKTSSTNFCMKLQICVHIWIQHVGSMYVYSIVKVSFDITSLNSLLWNTKMRLYWRPVMWKRQIRGFFSFTEAQQWNDMFCHIYSIFEENRVQLKNYKVPSFKALPSFSKVTRCFTLLKLDTRITLRGVTRKLSLVHPSL